ncbi:MAG: FAD binding domain-containing protein [Polyangiaceae bacterium]
MTAERRTDHVFAFWLNGRTETVRDADPHTTLLAYLRGRGLTGTKEGCAEGECGACAVVVLGRDAQGKTCFEALNSCLILLADVAGAEVWTVEGVGKSTALHPVQAALADGGGSQCGYCTPGFVMSLFAHAYSSPRGDADEALSGNLCRCTGYRPIREAARSLPVIGPEDPFAARLGLPATALMPLHYGACGIAFDRPASLAEALDERARHPEARIVAGGTDVVVEMNQEGTRHPRFLALDAVPELRAIWDDDDHLVLGAGLTLRDIETRVGTRIPLLLEVIPLFASPLIRARATIGGNLGTASPIGDLAPALLALDAEIEMASVRGQRRVPVREFFTGYRRTVLEPDELLVAIRVPARAPSHARFLKVSKRMLDDISSVAAAFAIDVEDGVISRARLAYGGVAATTVRAEAAERALIGAPWNRSVAETVRGVLEGAFSPIDDVRASAAYRQAMVVSLFERFVWERAET